MKKLLSFLFLFAFLSFPASSQKTGKENYNYLRGVEAYEAGHYREAANHLADALNEDDENGYAFTYLANVYRQMGYNGEALSYYKRAMKYVPAKDKEFHAQIYSERANTFWAMDDTLRSLAEQEQAVRLMPKEGKYLRERAYIENCMGDYAKAEADYKKALAADTADVYARYYLATNAISQKKWNDAIHWARETLQRDSEYIQMYLTLTEACFRQGKIGESAAWLAQAWRFDESSEDEFYWTDTLAQADYAATVQAFEAAQKRWEGNYDLYFALSHAAFSTRRYATALNFMQKFVATQDNGSNHYFTGYLLERMYRSDEAMQEMRLAFEADSSKVDVTLTCGDYLCYAGNYQESLHYFNKGVSENPLLASAYGGRCYLYSLMGNKEAALDDADHYTTLAPNSSGAQMMKANLLLRAGRIEEARPYLEEAVRLDSVAYQSSDRMFALFHLGRVAEAEEWTKKMLQEEEAKMAGGQFAQPDELAYTCAARFYALKGDKEQALKCLRTAFENNFRDFRALKNNVHLASLQGDEAFEALLKEYAEKPATWK